jgi:hypothetical protein
MRAMSDNIGSIYSGLTVFKTFPMDPGAGAGNGMMPG